MFRSENRILQSRGRQNPGLFAETTGGVRSVLWIALGFGLAALAFATGPADSSPQIQGEHLRIEFDQNLRSRVIARFDQRETTLGPFTASETITAANKIWSSFVLTSQKREKAKDAIGAYERLTLAGKDGILIKTVSVTIYDDFPSMAFFDVQYTTTGTTDLTVQGWANNA